MDRARRWIIVSLVGLTGVVVGFARLDRDGDRPAVAPAQPVVDFAEADAEQGERSLRDFVELLEEGARTGTSQWRGMPPLDQLPPLPSELLPAHAAESEG
jgi:hypothetical protein